MYKLEKSYGKATYDKWVVEKPKDLGDTQTNTDQANKNIWEVKTFRELLECVAFLSSMNKRLTLFFRGQPSDERDPLPVLFRDKWKCFDTQEWFPLTAKRQLFWEQLPRIGQQVYKICLSPNLGLPRWRALRDIREVQWAVIQHYGLWPTPLIDITSSLRIAASFAMDLQVGIPSNHRRGFVFVVGMPSSTGSITFDIDQQLCLARLYSACPPVAKRPHYQDGFLAGKFPIYSMADHRVNEKSNLLRRLVAKFSLADEGSFWDEDFPIIRDTAVYPENDPLRSHFLEEFGMRGQNSLYNLAKDIIS